MQHVPLSGNNAWSPIEALMQHALQPAQRVRLEVEARAGEQKVEVGNATSHEQLQALLGLASPISHARPPLPVPQALPEPDTHTARRLETRPKAPARRRGRVGVRAPARDPVGGAASETLPSKCTFAGAVDVEPMRLRQAETRALECPACGAVRTVHLHGDVVRFPPHQLLRTRTTKDVTRWIRQGTVWTLWEKPR
jgi:hypothetical protein